MRTKLLTLAVGAAMLTGSGLARAEITAPTLTPFGATTNAQMETANVGQSRVSTRVVMTDDQMQKVTAGHYNGYWHYGWFYLWSSLDQQWSVWGWHKFETHY
jgi:hypothetical protein